MQLKLELLAPAKNKDIGIAAIDCGADAVYMAGPSFGAREAAGNSFEDIAEVASYAHRFGAKVYLTLNTIIFENELESAQKTIAYAAEAGVDAIIVQDLGVLKMQIPPVELHASTQCNIRTPEQARFLESLGFTRIILARELSLEQIKAIRNAVSCEIETFVHGALCVSYSGQCYMSQYLTGRSANRGKCVQACRSKYDLLDADGRVLLRDKPILSLKDFSLQDRLKDLADAGVISFKIEGRLKNISYVRNVVRAYSRSLDRVVAESGGRYARSSFGVINGGFEPDTAATFSRGFTAFHIDGRRGQWNSQDFAKGIGEYIGTVQETFHTGSDTSNFKIRYESGISTPLANGDGLCFVSASGDVIGMRVNTVSGVLVSSSFVHGLMKGVKIYRNYNRIFEKNMENNLPERLLRASVAVTYLGEDRFRAAAISENGYSASVEFSADFPQNAEKAQQNLRMAFSKRSNIHLFSFEDDSSSEILPFLPISTANSIRRELAERLDEVCKSCDSADRKKRLSNGQMIVPIERTDRAAIVPPAQHFNLNASNALSRELYAEIGIDAGYSFEEMHTEDIELMRCKYCVRHELGLCPKLKKGEKAQSLYIVNNGKKFELRFDCRSCEMVVKSC